MHETIGTAQIDPELARIAPRIDGPVLEETLDALTSSGSLSRQALEQVKQQVARIMGSILGVYEREYGPGEVGPSGAGRVVSSKASTLPVTGLLYGRVQSGKTLAMITTTAMAIDNGFRVVVILTSDNVSLVNQTARRFRILPGVNVRDSTDIGSWLEDADHLRSSIGDAGFVLITAKNSKLLARFLEFLSRVGAPNFPALILDDEADQASLDTNTSARARARMKGGVEPGPSAIANRTSEGAEGESLRATLTHHVYLQVTATPYALLLQDVRSNLRPMFTELLEPGEGYTGSEVFFGEAVVNDIIPPLVVVPADEVELLSNGITEGLASSLGCFLVSAAIQGIQNPQKRYTAQNYLCHASVKKSEHGRIAEMVREFLGTMYESLRGNRVGARIVLEKAMRELEKTTELPDGSRIEDYVLSRLRDRELHIVNSEQDDANFGEKLNLIIGGNILGRGLTIENLLVTYYVRSAKVTQMDTMLQHARMFGYRSKILPLVRVFVPHCQAMKFYQIHEAEQALRAFLAIERSERAVPIHVGATAPAATDDTSAKAAGKLRPTRPNVLDPSNLVAWVPGQHLYPAFPYCEKDADKRHEKAKRQLARFFPNETFDPIPIDVLHAVTIDDAIDMITTIPYSREYSNNWDPDAIKKVLKSARHLFGDRILLHCREARRKALTQGNVSGDALKQLREQGVPVLCVFFDKRHELKFPPGLGQPEECVSFDYLFPEMVFPVRTQGRAACPAFVFNCSEDSAE